MKIYGDLEVYLGNVKMGAFVAKISEIDAPGWQRDQKTEWSVNSGTISGDSEAKQYCFAFDAASANVPLPNARLWIMRRKDAAHVTNIVPNGGQLSYDNYNGLLRLFHDTLAKPAADLLGVKTKLGQTDAGLEDIVSADSAILLRSFSSGANKSTGSGHPMDQRRWFAFIISCHDSGKEVPLDLLERWLLSDGWGEEEANTLILELEFGSGLLKQFTKDGK